MALKVILAITVMLAWMNVAEAAVSFTLLRENPDFPGMCYQKHDVFQTLLLPVGATMIAPAGHCYNVHCSKGSDSEFHLQFAGCGVVATSDPKCRVVTDKNAQYPDCCPDLQCNH